MKYLTLYLNLYYLRTSNGVRILRRVVLCEKASAKTVRYRLYREPTWSNYAFQSDTNDILTREIFFPITHVRPRVIRALLGFWSFFIPSKQILFAVRVSWNTKPMRTETRAIVFGVRGEIKYVDFDKKRRTIRRVKCRRKFGGHLKSANFFPLRFFVS